MTEQSLAELAGHDLAAMGLLSSLAERYRRDGLPGLRAAVEAMGFDAIAETLLVEAVLTIAERHVGGAWPAGVGAARGRGRPHRGCTDQAGRQPMRPEISGDDWVEGMPEGDGTGPAAVPQVHRYFRPLPVLPAAPGYYVATSPSYDGRPAVVELLASPAGQWVDAADRVYLRPEQVRDIAPLHRLVRAEEILADLQDSIGQITNTDMRGQETGEVWMSLDNFRAFAARWGVVL